MDLSPIIASAVLFPDNDKPDRIGLLPARKSVTRIVSNAAKATANDATFSAARFASRDQEGEPISPLSRSALAKTFERILLRIATPRITEDLSRRYQFSLAEFEHAPPNARHAV